MWTTEMNRFVIRAYYLCTALETDMSGRPQILQRFDVAYPEFAGRLNRNAMNARIRAIFRNNMLSEAEIDEIQQDVRRELRRRNSRASDVSRRSSARLSASFASEGRESVALVEAAIVDDPQAPEDPPLDQQLLRDLVFHMDEAVAQYQDTDPLLRPRVPKLQYSFKLTSAIQVMNTNVLPMYLETVQNLEDLCCELCWKNCVLRCCGDCKVFGIPAHAKRRLAATSPGEASSCVATTTGESDLKEACRNWKTDRVQERRNIFTTSPSSCCDRCTG